MKNEIIKQEKLLYISLTFLYGVCKNVDGRQRTQCICSAAPAPFPACRFAKIRTQNTSSESYSSRETSKTNVAQRLLSLQWFETMVRPKYFSTIPYT